MLTISSFLVAFSTLAFSPGLEVNHIPEAEPLSIQIVQEIVQPVEEVKPIPSSTPIVKGSACNCYNLLKEHFSSVPSMAELLSAASSTNGNVAVFKYPPSPKYPEYPEGIPHVAIIHSTLLDGNMYIEDYNLTECTHSFRIVAPNDKRLVKRISL